MLNKVLVLALVALAAAAPVEVAERDNSDPVGALISSLQAAAPKYTPVPPPFPDPSTDPQGFIAWLQKTYPHGTKRDNEDPVGALISSIQAATPKYTPVPPPFPDPSTDPEGFIAWLQKTYPNGTRKRDAAPAPAPEPAAAPKDNGHPAQVPKRPSGHKGAHPAQVPKRPAGAEGGAHPAQVPKKGAAPKDGAHPAQVPHKPAPAGGAHPAQVPKKPAPKDGAHPAQIPHRPAHSA